MLDRLWRSEALAGTAPLPRFDCSLEDAYPAFLPHLPIEPPPQTGPMTFLERSRASKGDCVELRRLTSCLGIFLGGGQRDLGHIRLAASAGETEGSNCGRLGHVGRFHRRRFMDLAKCSGVSDRCRFGPADCAHDTPPGARRLKSVPGAIARQGGGRYIAIAVHSTEWENQDFEYTMGEASGIQTKNREILERLHQQTSGPFTPNDAAKLLSLDARRSRRLLAYFASRGWLSRVRRGLYTTVPLGAAEPSKWREDPWIVAVSSFAPCYVGGWSACEHWGLTEQIFRDIVVITASSIRSRRQTIQGTSFHLKFLSEEKHFGTRTVWRDRTKIQVSDPSRTIVDVLDDPGIGGGIQHITGVLEAYFESKHASEAQLVQYGAELGNRTVFKRLGYLLETLGLASLELTRECLARKSSGLSSLDPNVSKRGRIVKRWNLRANVTIRSSGEPG